MKRIIRNTVAALLAAVGLQACHEAPDYDNTLKGNFDALWDIVDTRYCFFSEKEIDWRATGDRYRAQISGSTSSRALFDICAEMLNELQDGHVNLSSRYDTSYYREWWTDYPQDFNLRTLEQYYLDFDWMSASGMAYKMLDGEIGYVRYPSFANTVGETSLDYVLSTLGKARGLVIDIRDNGGGALTNIETLVGRFIDKPFTGAYIIHKTGPGHNDFSEPYPIVYKPAAEGRVKWTRPVVLLTNRSCYSAANAFAAVMKELPQVTVVGARTGGGGGLPFSSELPVGWSVRFSACPLLNARHESIETGIEPSEGCEVHAPADELAQGRDAILDFALALLREKP